VVRLSSIGDIVHALPAVSALGESLSHARIAWVIESRYAELLAENPFVGSVIPFDTLGWRRHWSSRESWETALSTVHEIRSFRPDIAVDFQGLVKSAVVARLSQAPKRIGFGGRWLRESPAGALYTEGVTADGRQHVVEENLALVERLGVRPVPRESWKFPLPRTAEAENQVAGRLAALGAREFIVINPGGGWTSKRWAPEQYAELIREFTRIHAHHVFLTGSPAEEPLIDALLTQAQSPRTLYFPSTLLEFIAFVRRASLFVGGDTGPLHLASAVGTPIVAIYGPTNPARNGPFAADDITVWNEDRPAGRRGYAHWGRGEARSSTYLEGIEVKQVLAAVSKRLENVHGG
jgi:heptosyltransferase-1